MTELLGEKKEAGTIDLVAGLSIDKDLSLADDKSRIYISSKTNIDKNFNIKVGSDKTAVASIGIKSDEIRVIARKGMKVIVEGGDLFISADNVYIDKGTEGESAVLGETIKALLEKLADIVKNHKHGSPAGPTTPMLPPEQIQIETDFKMKLSDFLSKTIKLKKN